MRPTAITDQPTLVCGPFDAEDLAGTTFVAANLAGGTLLRPHAVTAIVTVALAGGSPSVDVGDSDATDSWLSIAGDTIPVGVGSEAETYENLMPDGKFYPSADELTITLSSGLTAGEFWLVVSARVLGGVVR